MAILWSSFSISSASTSKRLVNLAWVTGAEDGEGDGAGVATRDISNAGGSETAGDAGRSKAITGYDEKNFHGIVNTRLTRNSAEDGGIVDRRYEPIICEKRSQKE